MQSGQLPPHTTDKILACAWTAVADGRRSDISLAEIARAAGVSRQSVYLAFGDRAGLLTAMAREADAKSAHSHRMRMIAEEENADGAALIAFIDAWLKHIPEIYPVAVLLSAAAVTDTAAAAAFNDRMIESLLQKYREILRRLYRAGALKSGWSADAAADFCWSLTHIDAWKNLVTTRGWTPARFRKATIGSISATLIA